MFKKSKCTKYLAVLTILTASLVSHPVTVPAQQLPSVVYGNWEVIAEGVRYREAESASPTWQIQIVEVDLAGSHATLLPVRSLVPGGYERTTALSGRVDGIAAINGGYFGGGVSYSHFEVYNNISSINAASRPPRTTLGIGMNNDPVLIRPVGSSGLPVPAVPAWANVVHAIGGGPRIVTNGGIDLRDEEEEFGASGVGPTIRHPRTALGYNEQTRKLFLDRKSVV